MKRLVLVLSLGLGACFMPEFPDFEARFPRPDAGGPVGGGGGTEEDAGGPPMCSQTLPLSAEQLLRIAVRASSCGVTEGIATPHEWPRLLLEWARVHQRSVDYDGVPSFVDPLLRAPCLRLKCLAQATTCDEVFACYGGATVPAGDCAAGDSCDFGAAIHCDAARGPAWRESCSVQGQSCTLDSTGHAVCGQPCSPATREGQCAASNTQLLRCNAGAGRLSRCDGRCVENATTASCAAVSGGQCTGNVCNGDLAVDCPTRQFGDSLDCAALTGGTCAQLPTSGPVFCAPKGGASCQGTLGFFTTCDGTQLVVCANNRETRVDCAALGFTSCVNGGPAGLCR